MTVKRVADPRSRAARNKEIRQENLRDYLSQQKHVQAVCKIVDRLLDFEEQMDQREVRRIEVALNAKFRLIAKYLPDLKAVEVQNDIGDIDRGTVEGRVLELIRGGLDRTNDKSASAEVD